VLQYIYKTLYRIVSGISYTIQQISDSYSTSYAYEQIAYIFYINLYIFRKLSGVLSPNACALMFNQMLASPGNVLLSIFPNTRLYFVYGVGEYKKNTPKFLFWYCVFCVYSIILNINPAEFGFNIFSQNVLFGISLALYYVPIIYVCISYLFSKLTTPPDFYEPESIAIQALYTIVSDTYLLLYFALGCDGLISYMIPAAVTYFSLPVLIGSLFGLCAVNRICFFSVMSYSQARCLEQNHFPCGAGFYSVYNCSTLKKRSHDAYSRFFGLAIEDWIIFTIDAKLIYLLCTTPIFLFNFLYFSIEKPGDFFDHLTQSDIEPAYTSIASAKRILTHKVSPVWDMGKFLYGYGKNLVFSEANTNSACEEGGYGLDQKYSKKRNPNL